jgi:hypothetical protein
MIIIEAAELKCTRTSRDYLSANGKQIDQCLCSLFFLLIAMDIPYFSPQQSHYIHQKRRCLSECVSQKFPRAATGTIRQNLSLLLGWMENAAAAAAEPPDANT